MRSLVHEKRNFFVILLLVVASLWSLAAWLVLADPFGSAPPEVWMQRILATSAAIILAAITWYALRVEDKLPDYLGARVGPVYFEADGLSFMPAIRVREDGQAELQVYYQNRYENYCQAIVHLRPPHDAFVARAGTRDLHFAFKADGGEFGVLHQPIAVPRKMQGEVIEILLAAATRFPRARGGVLRKREGKPCGTLPVDWGQAFRVGVHEVSEEIELIDPCALHLSMPHGARHTLAGPAIWKHEILDPGQPGSRVLT
jgi:hypothetical protein